MGRNYEAVEDGSMKLILSDSAKMKAKDPIKTLGFEDEEEKKVEAPKIPILSENGENLYKKRTV